MEHPFEPLEFTEYPEQEMLRRAREFYVEMNRRRTVREFSDRVLPLDLLRAAIATAGTAPSGAHKQPWHFALVGDPVVKRKIRDAAEREEKESYEHRMPQSWLDDLAPLGTDWHKPFLTVCPWLIVVFAKNYDLDEADGSKRKNYYVQESVGIAVGFLLAALHRAGVATLTHTPSPMGFLQELLGRPANERAYMLIAVGYPAEGCRVPSLTRLPLQEILSEK
jgi:nitroreductase